MWTQNFAFSRFLQHAIFASRTKVHMTSGPKVNTNEFKNFLDQNEALTQLHLHIQPHRSIWSIDIRNFQLKCKKTG